MKRILPIAMVIVSAGALRAQTPLYTDGLLMPKKDLGMGLFYSHDQWNKYWQDNKKRDNGNLGTVSTQSVTWMGAYGLTDKATLVATLPYVWTKASGGTLHGMSGLQDITLAAKYNFWSLKGEKDKSTLKFFGLIAFSMPVSNYSLDMIPLSIGQGSKNISYRLAGTYTYNQVWFATLSGAYTWRSNVSLDRPAYYTNGHLYSTNEVQMPNLFDFIVRAGYHKKVWRAEVYYTQQNCLGGGSLGLQDVGFVSFQMNYSKVGGSLMYASPKFENIAVRAWGDYIFAGRNVGQSTAFTLGAMYFFHFSKNQK